MTAAQQKIVKAKFLKLVKAVARIGNRFIKTLSLLTVSPGQRQAEKPGRYGVLSAGDFALRLETRTSESKTGKT